MCRRKVTLRSDSLPSSLSCRRSKHHRADIDDALKNTREATEEYEKKRNKPPLAESSDQRQMAELKRKGVSGDDIAGRFGIDCVRQYNKAHPESPIRTTKHSKLGAPGFSW